MEALGIESGDTSAPSVVDRRENDADRTTQDDRRRREVSASAVSTDAAIRAAAKVAIDADDLTRARALLDLLEAKPRATSVVTLAPRRLPR